MLSIIAFVIGLIVLLRGGFRIGNRAVPTPNARVTGLILMAPLVLVFCASPFFAANAVVPLENGTFGVDQEVFNAAAGTLQTIEIVLVVMAGGLVVYNYLMLPTDDQLAGRQRTQPEGDSTASQPRTITPPTSADRDAQPRIITPPKTVNRDAHPLEGAPRQQPPTTPARRQPTPAQHPLGGSPARPRPEAKPAAKAEPPAIMTLAEAAAYSKRSAEELLQLIEASKLGAVRYGTSYKIARSALDDLITGESR